MTTKALQEKTQLLRDRLEQSIARKHRSHQLKVAACINLPAPQWDDVAADNVADAADVADVADAGIAEEVDIIADARASICQLQSALPPLAASPQIHSNSNHECDNKRGTNRKPSQLAGHICNEGSSTMVDVIIKDLSANGARFTLDRGKSGAFSATPAVAEQFHLYITYDRMFVRCKLQWRNGDAFGVRYLAAPQFY